MLPPALFALALLALSPLVHAADKCQCGFSVNTTSDPNYQLFTEYVETDFTKRSLGDWIPQDYSINATEARGPYGKNSSVNNVVLGPEGVELWVRRAVGNMVPMAEIDTKRTDMLYGSFRARIKFASGNGTCGAMFWYRDNTQEIDMEFLSKQFNETNSSDINLVIQSPESKAAGYNAVFTPGYKLSHLPFRPDKDFHEYRFDWTPTEVAFYADNKLLYVMMANVPAAPGKMMFNHWSNGDPGWSAGPPEQDTAMTIAQAMFYFNSSDPKLQSAYKKSCPTFDPSRVCTIGTSASTAIMPTSQPSRPASPDKDHARLIYIVIGVVVGVVIIGFIGCMVTFRRWVALKNRLFGPRQRAAHKALSPPADKDVVPPR